MAFITVLNRQNWPSGRHSFGPYPIPVGSTFLNARMARFEKLGNGKRKQGTEWVDLRDAQNVKQDVIKYALEISYDNAVTWFPLDGGTASGGIEIVSPGLGAPPEEREYTTTSVSIERDVENIQRMVRGWVETYTTLGTTIEVEFT